MKHITARERDIVCDVHDMFRYALELPRRFRLAAFGWKQVGVSIPKANRRRQVGVSIPKANRRSPIEQDFRLEVGV